MTDRVTRILSFTLSALIAAASCAPGAAAKSPQQPLGATTNTTQTTHAVHPSPFHAHTILFIYDPGRSGTVAVSYVNKFRRLAALLVQPHTSRIQHAVSYFRGSQGCL